MALARQLLAISETTLEEATKTLEFTRLGFEVGRLPEFDLLRAQVARGNQLPEIARRRSALAQSELRLKQLLDMPSTTSIAVDADLLSAALEVPAPFRTRFQAAGSGPPPASGRAPVRQADAVVRQNEANLRLARAQRNPSLTIVSDYNLVAYPSKPVPTARDQLRNNWTLGASLQIPLFQGGRIRADIQSAESNLDGAVAQRQLTRELAELDSSVTWNQVTTAEEAWQASAGTVAEAGRAFEVASLRYRQGISSQLEVNDARLALEQARVNRAQAARDLQVARVTVALLPLLPLNNQLAAPGQPQLVQRSQPAGATRQTFNPFAAGGGGSGTMQQSPGQQQPASSAQQGLPRTGSRRFP
jgi:outer membrane protein TolC